MPNPGSGKSALILGAGLAGTATALGLKARGWTVQVVSLESGATSLSSGAWDLGAIPLLSDPPLAEHFEKHTLPLISKFWIGGSCPPDALQRLERLSGGPVLQDLLELRQTALLLPTTQGFIRKAFIAQKTQARADLRADPQRIAVIGDPRWNYPAQLLAQSWQKAQIRLSLQHEFRYFPICTDSGRGELQDLERVAMELVLDKNKRAAFIDALRVLRGQADLLLLPPVCLSRNLTSEIESVVGIPVAEPLCSRETIAGRRLQQSLEKTLSAAEIPVMAAEECQLRWRSGSVLQADMVSRSRQKKSLTANEYVVATGRFVGRGFRSDSVVCETSVGGLPVFSDPDRVWTENYPPDKAYNRMGLKVDESFRPWVSPSTTAENVRAVGSCIGGFNLAKEKMGLAVMAVLGDWCAQKMAGI